MKSFYILSICLLSTLVTSCSTTKQASPINQDWTSVAKMEDSEIFVNTTSIKRENNMLYATEKKVFTTAESKELYVSKIYDEYSKMGKSNKISKWDDFSYTIYTAEYDCQNNRFRVLAVEDFDSTGKRIIRTTPNKKTIKWLNVDKETVGDYTFFFVCDYDS